MAQDAARTPAIFDVDRAVLTPFLTQGPEDAFPDINSASVVASGVLTETGSDIGALAAFSGYSASVSQLGESSRIEVRVFDPALLSRPNRLFDP